VKNCEFIYILFNVTDTGHFVGPLSRYRWYRYKEEHWGCLAAYSLILDGAQKVQTSAKPEQYSDSHIFEEIVNLHEYHMFLCASTIFVD